MPVISSVTSLAPVSNGQTPNTVANPPPAIQTYPVQQQVQSVQTTQSVQHSSVQHSSSQVTKY